MSAAVMLGFAAALLALAAAAEARGSTGGRTAPELRLPPSLAPHVARLGLTVRIARAGLAGRVTVAGLVAMKSAGAFAGLMLAPALAPVAPGRLALVVAVGLPVAGFLAPDAWLERRARFRARSLRASLPDALDLLATAAAAGRSPLSGFAEISRGGGALGRELAMVVAETSCGAPQREAFAALRYRVPAKELAAMCSAIERSRRHGSPLADQLHDQAGSLRGSQRRRIAEQAAKAAPKIQLAVALLLVPSVLLMIAAGLIANSDRFLAGL